MRFDDVADLLPGVVDGSVELDERTAEFIATDLRCQAELARYRRLLRSLASLRARFVEPPPGLLAETLAAIEADVERRRVRDLMGSKTRHVAIAGAIGGAAVAAAGAATVVLLARSRRRLAG